MKVWERFIEYVKVPTAGDEDSSTVPSTIEQLTFAQQLEKELQQLGLETRLDENGYVYGKLKASKGYEEKPVLGFIAHMDTVADFAEKQVVPVIHENYDGNDLVLGDGVRELSTKMFPHLKDLKGRTLITSEGDTILGADDKAGVAEIITLLEKVINEKIPHGALAVAFTPDEEIGRGADYFDVEYFGADFAYTMDGGPEGEIEYENFNAAGVKINVTGVNVHPGSAKDIMINAAQVAAEFAMMLPNDETPETTEGYQGFYHLTDMKGEVKEAELSYIVRDHDADSFAKRRLVMEKNVACLNEKYGEGTVSMQWREQYRNMSEKIKEHFHLIENAKLAAEYAGIQPVVVPIRGGTDGARLSFMGLPCPNLGTGGYAFHGPFEHITVEGMEHALEMMLEIVKIYSR